MTNAIGFKPLDNSVLRTRFESELHKIGYFMVLPCLENPMVTTCDIQVEPLGHGPSFTLRLIEDWNQEWSDAELIRKSDLQEVGFIRFDRTKRYETSCYHVWIDDIVKLVREHSIIE